MKYIVTLAACLLFLCTTSVPTMLLAQGNVQPKNMMTSGPRNYKTFNAPQRTFGAEGRANNKGYEQHPETGVLFAEAPCADCYELVGKRTEMSKTFVKEGTEGKTILQQTSSAPMHHKDAQGNWRTIQTQLQPTGKHGVYAATEQEVPVTIAATDGASLGVVGKQLQWNHDLEMIFVNATGTEVNLGKADWAHHTAGDDGVYVTNAWPGVDIEVFVLRGAVKTNFWINRPMPAYAGGKLLLRDHLLMGEGMKLFSEGGNTYTGNLEVRSNSGEKMYAISAATAFERNDAKSTLQFLQYNIAGNVLDIAVPGSLLNKAVTAYPVVIDPLVSTTSAVTGSTYSPSFTAGCTYSNAATVPAMVTITDVQFSFQYVTSGGALLNNGAFDFKLGSCKSPGPAGLFWNCFSTMTGTCTASGASIYSSLTSCLPAPRCTPLDLNLTMNFYQNYLSTTACSNLYISAGTPLLVTVTGNTIGSVTVTSGSTTICQGQSTTLTAAATLGVPPYTYTWAPGGYTGSSVAVTPTVTTTYTLTAADACGNTTSGTQAVVVNPVYPITGATAVCKSSATTLSNAVSGGTWHSSSTGIASITGSGIVTGMATGTAAISYTTPAACISTTTLTVLALPALIAGQPMVCQNSTATLTNATTGGTWSSSNTAIASVAVSAGIVTGVTPGTSRITYTSPNGCIATLTMTVHPILPIAGTTNVCIGGNTTLTDAVPGGTWRSSNTAVASLLATPGMLSGISAGTSLISYTMPTGCRATTTLSVYALPAITGSGMVCQGSTTLLAEATTGGTWSSTASSIASAGVTTGIISGITPGTAIISYTTSGGCYTANTIAVDAVAPVLGPTTLCAANSATLTNAITGGTWSSSNTSVVSVDAAGLEYGAGVGSAMVNYTNPVGCISTAAITVVTAPATIAGAGTVCQLATTTLTDPTPGGTWMSSDPATAITGSATGIVTGLMAGTVTVTYTTVAGCYATKSMVVHPLAPILGSTMVCPASTATLTDATPGGTWSSSNAAVASMNTVTGLLTGVTNGTATIYYTTPMGCVANATAVVSPLLPITGNTDICTSSTLVNAVTGGSWVSSMPSVAPVGAMTGIVTAAAIGTAIITYTTPGGCITSTPVNVNPLMPVTGVTDVCMGNTVTMSNTAPGGAWSSANTSIASVDASGVVTGVAAGAVNIRYTTFAGCVSAALVTVNPIYAITGSTTVCQGSASLLSNAAPGGSWISSNTTVAPIGPATGLVMGVTPGTATIVYTTAAGCTAQTTVQINPLSAVGGTPNVCKGYTISLFDATPGGTWSSTNTALATATPITGIVTGVAPGVVTIRYTTGLGCMAAYTITVNAMPGAITGSTTVCAGSTTTLGNTLAGGTWGSINPAVAAIGMTTGVASGVTADTATIIYTTTGDCSVNALLTVNPLPAAITGPTYICEHAPAIWADATPGGNWSSSNTTAASINTVTGAIAGGTAGTTTIKYMIGSGCFVSAVLTVHPMPSSITGTTTLCAGSSSVLGNALAGGTWSSSNAAIATMVAGSGLLTGVTAGPATISYITPYGCYVVASALVNPTPSITAISSTNPTKCTTTDGTITLSGLIPGETYAVNYSYGSTPVSLIIVANAAGNVVISGLAAGPYINFSATTGLGCSSGIKSSLVTLVLPSAPPAPVAGSNTPLCDGSQLKLTASNTLAGVSYLWNGPGGFTSTLQDPVINPTHMNAAGVYTVTSSIFECTSPAAMTTVIIHPIPEITTVTAVPPATCLGHEGSITLSGLLPGLNYALTYTYDGTPLTASVTATSDGTVQIPGLAAGTYSNIRASSYTCASNSAGPVTLTDPVSPSVPELTSNSPICTGKSLVIKSADDMAGLTFEWEGPNGYRSDLQNPTIDNIRMDDSGTYTLTVRHLNCPATASTLIVVRPPVTLTNVSPSQVIPVGSSIRLHAAGAMFYVWTPSNGSLDFPNIDTPLAMPEETMLYTVHGMNSWGCMDTAQVLITVDNNINEFIPTGFTPNGDGNNDIFRIGNSKYDKLLEFNVYNRWGQLIYHNSSDISKGWDGTYNGVTQDMGVYNYSIIVEVPGGKLKSIKGDVTLLR